jgi:hypothetical protein
LIWTGYRSAGMKKGAIKRDRAKFDLMEKSAPLDSTDNYILASFGYEEQPPIVAVAKSGRVVSFCANSHGYIHQILLQSASLTMIERRF